MTYFGKLFRAAAVGTFLLASAPCLADTVEEHDEEGERLYIQKQYESALREFRAAYRLNAQPRFLFNIGQCYRRLGLGPEAVDYFQRYLHEEKSPDPTIRAELYAYIDQIQAAQDSQEKKREKPQKPEPPPRLVADEIVDLEDLGDQVVRDYKSGSSASANELLSQVKQVFNQRHDPIVFYYVARTYERMGKRNEALEYYRRYLGTEETDSPLRQQAAAQLVILTPPPPGQKLLWPALALGILGVAGIATGIGLYFESSTTFNQYLQPLPEPDKRALRERGEPLALGSTVAYAVGGGLLGTAAIFSVVALVKGVRKKPPSLIRVPSPDEIEPASAKQRVSLRLTPSLQVGFPSGGFSLSVSGGF